LKKGQILVTKVGTLHKHASWKKIVVVSARIVVGDWYYNKESTPAKN
jgi:hypothetical protein